MKRLPFVFLIALFLVSCTTESDITVYENNSFNPFIEAIEDSGIPYVKINTKSGFLKPLKMLWQDASIEVVGNYCGKEDLTMDDIKIKGRGNSSWTMPKKSYSLKFDSKSKVLGMKKSKRWVLIANYADKSLLRNYYASYLGNEIYKAEWSPSFKSVHLIIDGSYQGVYLLGEQIKIDGNRIDIDDISETEIDEGGFIFEINGRMDELFNFRTEKGVCISLKDPDEVGTDIQQKVKDVIQTAENALYSENFTDADNGWRKYFDEDSVIDWYIINEFTKNADSANFTSIYFYYNPSDRLLHMGPIWDFDISCGNINYNGCDSYEGLYVKENSVWIKQMFNDPAFVTKVNARWNDKKSDLQNSITGIIQNEADSLSAAADLNFMKWLILGKYVWPNASGYKSRKTYQSEIDYLKNWLSHRYDSMDGALNSL